MSKIISIRGGDGRVYECTRVVPLPQLKKFLCIQPDGRAVEVEAPPLATVPFPPPEEKPRLEPWPPRRPPEEPVKQPTIPGQPRKTRRVHNNDKEG